MYKVFCSMTFDLKWLPAMTLGSVRLEGVRRFMCTSTYRCHRKTMLDSLNAPLISAFSWLVEIITVANGQCVITQFVMSIFIVWESIFHRLSASFTHCNKKVIHSENCVFENFVRFIIIFSY